MLVSSKGVAVGEGARSLKSGFFTAQGMHSFSVVHRDEVAVVGKAITMTGCFVPTSGLVIFISFSF
jgi:hypothetical protein